MEPGCFGFRSRRAPVYGARGMVATSQPLASEAGLRLLQQGGSAADACVAAAAALNATEPCNTGLGGDAFALFFEAKTKKVHCLQGCGRSPAALTLEGALAHPDVSGTSLHPMSALCVTVPGTASAWEAAVAQWGTKSLREVLQPAIELAEGGFPVSQGAAQIWQQSEELLAQAARGRPTPYLPGGRAPKAGEIFRNPDLAQTMRLLGEKGAKEGFYTGAVAEEIVKALAARGGVMSAKDLAEHSCSFVEPISSCYRGRFRLYECPPPTQGVTALMALNLLEQLPAPPRLSSEAIHAQAEALRFAFADALQFCADPAGRSVSGELLDKAPGRHQGGAVRKVERAAKRWKQMFDPNARAAAVAPDGEGVRMGPDTVHGLD
ncbi:unnamed protein product [Durusdinium trenchii]|uniref:Gamma-glutamyltransferase n=1 Tax=Durusdinium trenchii TaxID=1381693 RepID=A0ABP0Q999_9DINO